MNCDLLIKGKYVLPIDERMLIFNDGIIAIAGEKIIDIGLQGNLENKYNPKKIIDAGNSIVMPGLINCHTHAAMTYFRGLADDLPLDQWLNKHIWPAEAKNVKPDFIFKSRNG